MTRGGLVGRDRELARLREMVSRVAAGRGGVAWIGGEPGIGKSALVDAGLRGVVGVRVFRGGGEELTQSFALRLMADSLDIHAAGDPYRGEIADLLAGRVAGIDAVRAACEQMVALVHRECAKSPVVLVGDDLQWADDASLGLWRRLAGMTGQAPLLVIGVSRAVPTRAEVDETREAVARRPDAAVLDLGPLDDGQVATMAGEILSASAGSGLCGVLTRAAGNPLYVRELVDALVADGLVRVSAGVADVVKPVGEDLATLNEAIGRRLSFLSAPARSALRAASVLSSPFTMAELGLVAGGGEPELSGVVTEALAAGVLADPGTALTFRHALIQQVLLHELPVAVRLGLHAHMARAEADACAPWDRVARHLLAGPESLDGWVLAWLAGVPASALYALPSTAAPLLDRARHAGAPGDRRRSELTARLTTVLRLQRRAEDVISRGGDALAAVAEPERRGEIAWNLSWAHRLMGRNDAAELVVAQVLAGPDPGMPWRGRLRAERAILLNVAGHADESYEQAHLAIAEGERGADPVSIGLGLSVLMRRGGADEALAVLDRGLSVLVRDDRETMNLRLQFIYNRLVTLGYLDRFAEFEAEIGPAITLAERLGSPYLVDLHVVAGEQFLIRGDWDQALLGFRQIDAFSPYERVRVRGIQAITAIRRGDRAAAEGYIADVSDVPYLSGVDYLVGAAYLITARALMAEARGDLAAATKIMSVWFDPRIDASQSDRGERAVVLPELVRLALAAGDAETAGAAVATAAADARVVPSVVITWVANVCRAMVEDDPESLVAAAHCFDRGSRPPQAAFAWQEAAVRLAMRREAAAGRDAFERAAEIYERLGAVLDLRRLKARLRHYGIRSGARATHARVSTGWDALTTTEREVAALVARGGANPEIAAQLFVSPRTIETHVTHIQTKLQVRSRIDLVREISRHMTPDLEPDAYGERRDRARAGSDQAAGDGEAPTAK